MSCPNNVKLDKAMEYIDSVEIRVPTINFDVG